MGRIPEHIVEQIRDTARVEEVIGEFVELKRAGSNLKGFSPFNNERTPSFFVSPAKQIWKDFSSGKGGDVVKFLMEHESMSYPEALRWLARKYNIAIPEEEPDAEAEQRRRERESLLLALEFARDWFVEQLYNTDEGRAIGLSYFRERGFLEKTLREFDIGYAPEAYDAFYKAATAKGFKDDVLEGAGLIIRKNDRVVDRFYGRVIFPIHRLGGNVVGFAGRILDTSKHPAKYINSPETEVYHKSKILYGIHKAKSHIGREDNAYLVEGYTDVLAFYQAGIQNTVASAGTSLTEEQVRLIKRFTPNITLVYDGDPAGLRAAIRGVDIILENDMNVRVVVLPEGEDPDSYAHKVSAEELVHYLDANSKDFIEFAAEILLQDQTDPVRIFEMIRHVVESIAKIPNEIKRELYIRRVAQITGIDEHKLFVELHAALRRKIRSVQGRLRQELPTPKMQVAEPQITLTERIPVLEREIIKILLLYGHEKALFPYYKVKDEIDGELQIDTYEVEQPVWKKIHTELTADEVEFASPVFRALYDKLIDTFLNGETPDVAALSKELPEEHLEVLSDIVFDNEKHRLSDWSKRRMRNIDPVENLSRHVTQVLYNLRYELLLKSLDDFQRQQFPEPGQDLEPDKAEAVLEEMMQYIKLKKLIGSILHRVV